jgi:rubrerythrin
MNCEQTPPIPTGAKPPKGQTIWECPSCARRYLTEQPPEKCPFCLKPIKA